MKKFILIAGAAIVIPTTPAIAGSSSGTSHSATAQGAPLLKVKAGASATANAKLNVTLGSGSGAKHAVKPTAKNSTSKLLRVNVGQGARKGGAAGVLNTNIVSTKSGRGAITAGNLGATKRGSLARVSAFEGKGAAIKSARSASSKTGMKNRAPLVKVSALNARSGKSGRVANVAVSNGSGPTGRSAVSVSVLNRSAGKGGRVASVSVLNGRGSTGRSAVNVSVLNGKSGKAAGTSRGTKATGMPSRGHGSLVTARINDRSGKAAATSRGAKATGMPSRGHGSLVTARINDRSGKAAIRNRTVSAHRKPAPKARAGFGSATSGRATTAQGRPPARTADSRRGRSDAPGNPDSFVLLHPVSR